MGPAEWADHGTLPCATSERMPQQVRACPINWRCYDSSGAAVRSHNELSLEPTGESAYNPEG